MRVDIPQYRTDAGTGETLIHNTLRQRRSIDDMFFKYPDEFAGVPRYGGIAAKIAERLSWRDAEFQAEMIHLGLLRGEEK